MAPWMVIVGLIAIGFIVLLVAPTIHRRINVRSRATAEAGRVARANALRTSADGAVRVFGKASDAIATRDRLLLRGVRAEVVPSGASTSLIYHVDDTAVLEMVLTELGID